MQPADEPGWQIESRAAERVEMERIRVKDNLEIDRRNEMVRPHQAAGPVHGWPEPAPDPADQPYSAAEAEAASLARSR